MSFVRDARARGVRTAIISSSQNCAAVFGAAGLSQLFDVRVDGIDLRRLGLQGKPAPDMCNRFDVTQIQKTSFEFSLLRGCSGGASSPNFYRLYGNGNFSLASYDDHRPADLTSLKSAQEIETIDLGHSHIGDDATGFNGGDVLRKALAELVGTYREWPHLAKHKSSPGSFRWARLRKGSSNSLDSAHPISQV